MYLIAVCGKGGTGKTTVAALLINWLNTNKKGSILAVDADPNSNLGESLGLVHKESIADIVEAIARDPGAVPANMSKDHYIEYRVQLGLTEGSGVDLLVMGRPEGPGCYCYVNNVLRNIMGKIIKNYNFVVIDNEAGMEHLSRRTTRQADCLLLVSDNSVVGLRSAKRILDLAKGLDIGFKASRFIINRTNCRLSLKDKAEELGLSYLGCLPEDKSLLRLSERGQPLTELDKQSAISNEIDKMANIIWQ